MAEITAALVKQLHEYSSDLRAGDHDYAANYAAFANKYALVAEAV
jgi:hypothetical protein